MSNIFYDLKDLTVISSFCDPAEFEMIDGSYKLVVNDEMRRKTVSDHCFIGFVIVFKSEHNSYTVDQLKSIAKLQMDDLQNKAQLVEMIRKRLSSS